MRLNSFCLAAASLAIGVFTAAMPAHAKVITLTFSGTYHTFSGPVFGLEGDAIPYQYQLTYDTALNTNLAHMAAGSQLGDYITPHDWYGYSASGLIAVTPLSFGNKTWALSDLLGDRSPAIGITADLWFDTDIAQHTPTRSVVTFVDKRIEDYGILQLGGGSSDGVSTYLESGSFIESPEGSAFSDQMTITPVPEGNPALLMFAGLGVLLLARRR